MKPRTYKQHHLLQLGTYPNPGFVSSIRNKNTEKTTKAHKKHRFIWFIIKLCLCPWNRCNFYCDEWKNDNTGKQPLPIITNYVLN